MVLHPGTHAILSACCSLTRLLSYLLPLPRPKVTPHQGCATCPSSAAAAVLAALLCLSAARQRRSLQTRAFYVRTVRPDSNQHCLQERIWLCVSCTNLQGTGIHQCIVVTIDASLAISATRSDHAALAATQLYLFDWRCVFTLLCFSGSGAHLRTLQRQHLYDVAFAAW